MLRVPPEWSAVRRRSKLLRSVVLLDGLGLDDHGRVPALDTARRGGDRPRHVAARESYHTTAGNQTCGSDNKNLLHRF